MIDDDETIYRVTPLGVLASVLPGPDARRAWNALELHIRRHYGPVGGIVVHGDEAGFTRLEVAQRAATSAPARIET